MDLQKGLQNRQLGTKVIKSQKFEKPKVGVFEDRWNRFLGEKRFFSPNKKFMRGIPSLSGSIVKKNRQLKFLLFSYKVKQLFSYYLKMPIDLKIKDVFYLQNFNKKQKNKYKTFIYRRHPLLLISRYIYKLCKKTP